MTYEPCGRIMVGSGSDTYDPNCTLAKGHAGGCKSTSAIDQHSFPPRSTTLHFCPACGRAVVGTYDIDERRKRCTKTIHLAIAVRTGYRRDSR